MGRRLVAFGCRVEKVVLSLDMIECRKLYRHKLTVFFTNAFKLLVQTGALNMQFRCNRQDFLG
ncbi:MAG: hypothetical protein D6742_09265 [Cyanobacteria bacterium J069]|nr:MAG: hypothetical protein D6742_09265 [Cyanobacteria bacterium J069]